jgi:hypothetical protein
MECCRSFEIFADYFQFVLMDDSPESDYAVTWSESALRAMIASGIKSVSLATLRNVTVPVTVGVGQSEPQIDLAQYDHAAAASLQVPSGRLVVMGCTGHFLEAPRIELPAGTYQLLYLAAGLESITYESDPANDSYIVHLWPGPSREPAVLKQWRPSA